MRTWFHSWRAAIRIARRDAWRSKGRSLLVLSMIALPILGVSAFDLTFRSSELTRAQELRRTIGAADARFEDANVEGLPILQDPQGDQSDTVEDFTKGNKPWPNGPTDVSKTLPAGATVLTDSSGPAKLTTTYGLLTTEVRELKAADPMAAGIMTLLDGRFPEKTDEVAATSGFLESSGLTVGSTLTARGFDREYRITGSYELPSDLKSTQINALPGAFLKPYGEALGKAGLSASDPTTTYLVKKAGGFTWDMVQKINTKGVKVVARDVALNPPPDSEVPLFQSPNYYDYRANASLRAAELVPVFTIVGLAMLEICLLAGPAFAVGARRSRRQLGLVGANGGARSHIRAIVLSGGLVIGVAAAIAGTVLALALTFTLRPLLEQYMGQRFGSFTIRPLELLAIAGIAVLTGLLSAIVPAVTASRQTVLASLTGRRGVRRGSRVLPLVGLAALLLGGTLAIYGAIASDQSIIVAGGSALAELGIVAMTPALVGLFGRTGRWLPLSPRLALRDAVRNRGRTAPAVAAVLAAVAGTVAVATYATSQDADNQATYKPDLPYGAVSVFVMDEGGRDAATAVEAIDRNLPIDVRSDVSRVNIGRLGCSPWGEEEGCGSYEVIVPPANQCPLWMSSNDDDSDPAAKFSRAQRRELAKDWRCDTQDRGGSVPVEGGLLVADASLLKVLGITDPGAARALAEGKYVSFDPTLVVKDAKGAKDGKSANAAAATGAKGVAKAGDVGTVSVKLITDNKAAARAAELRKEYPGEVKTFTAYEVPGSPNAYGVRGLISPEAVKAAGMGTAPLGAYFTTDRLPSGEQQQKLDAELAKLGDTVDYTLERGYVSRYGIVLLALTLFAGLVTIGAAGIATGLSQADAEADLKTLAAVGAPPRVRRTLSGFQCGVVAAMGVVLGSVSGVLPAIGLRLAEERQQRTYYEESLDRGWGTMQDSPPDLAIVIPWETLGALLVLVPLGAALLAALVTRSRGALARRAVH
ncbi:ligA protein [Streptomyces laurentii]|uniref:LigA protein n=1 Tax=Streptomyces laurentii TaxID=39478 RepID=A0A160NZT0_STRLU|nr:ligA protein [Streptomyces laurentii]